MQLTPLDVDYQQEEQAKIQAQLDELKKAKVIPREEPPTNFSFEPVVDPQFCPSTLAFILWVSHSPIVLI